MLIISDQDQSDWSLTYVHPTYGWLMPCVLPKHINCWVIPSPPKRLLQSRAQWGSQPSPGTRFPEIRCHAGSCAGAALHNGSPITSIMTKSREITIGFKSNLDKQYCQYCLTTINLQISLSDHLKKNSLEVAICKPLLVILGRLWPIQRPSFLYHPYPSHHHFWLRAPGHLPPAPLSEGLDQIMP